MEKNVKELREDDELHQAKIELAEREIELLRKEIKLTKRESELAQKEAEQAEKEAERARKEADEADAERQARQSEAKSARKEAEKARAEKQKALAEAEKEGRKSEKVREKSTREAEGKAHTTQPQESRGKYRQVEAQKGMSKKKAEARRQKARKKADQAKTEKNDREHRGKPTKYEQMSAGEAVKELSSDVEQGLGQSEAKQRLQKYGPNTIEEKKDHPVLRFFSYFWGPIPWMIEIAAGISAAVKHWEDFSVIFFMLLINGCVSYWHERKAGNAIKALKEKLAPEAEVIREGKHQSISAKGLVPGDIVIVNMGGIVPADAKLLSGQQVMVDESALTGESLPVTKEENDSIYSSTTVKQGQAKVLVVATGTDTRFGKTVELVQSAGVVSHFQKAVLRIGYFVIGLTGLLVASIVGVSLYRGDPWVEVLLFALVVTVAGIPAALPAVLTVTMTVGARSLAKMKAIVTHLASMEEMAGLRILCADKTGTLTKNSLELQDPVILEAENKKELMLAAALASRRESEDPIDNAVLKSLEGFEEISTQELDAYQILDFKPFDPTSKRVEAEVQRDEDRFRVAKGAPQVIMEMVATDESMRQQIEDNVDELGEQGFRALGVVMKNNGNWRFLGILPLLDPPRKDAAQAVQDAQNYGIDIRMVTGDHEAIAKQVADQVGLGTDIREAEKVFGDRQEVEIEENVMQTDGFSEVTPEHKFQIIRHMQANDYITGMTGDGVNDAPALKQANVGIAVASATDAARSAADLVLTEPGLDVIIRAVEEARRIFERMIGYATYRITETMRLVMFVAISVLALNFYSLTPIMVVLLAILNDIPIMLIAKDNEPIPRDPVRWDMKRVITTACILSVFGLFSTISLLWYIEVYLKLPAETVKTMSFLLLLVAGHLTIFLTRNMGWIWSKPLPNLYLFLALEGTQIIGSLFALFGIMMTAIPWQNVLFIWGYSIVWMLILNVIKVLAFKILRWQGGMMA